ncbi:MAG: hypothetical protein C4295_12100 [Candidatus Fervidibacterota bacterium]
MLAMVSRWVIGTEMVGVWHEPSLSRKTDAPRWAEALQKHGLTVRLLSSDDLANPQVLSPDRIAVVLLPYGPHFPADAVDNFCRYLKAGGRFVSLGGYAFDELFAKGKGHGAQGKQKWERVAHEKVQLDIAPHRIRITVPADAPVDWHRARTLVNLRPETAYMLTGKICTDGITNGHGAYFAVDYYDVEGNRIAFQQTQIVKRTEGWQEVGAYLRVPKGTVQAKFNCIVHGHGVAEFTEWRIQRIVNTRWGEARDWLHIEPDQIGIFDPSFRIDGATVLEAGSMEHGAWRKGHRAHQSKRRWVWKSQEAIRGYAAVGLIGDNNPVSPKAWARLIPVLLARDRYGRFLGPAFSVMHHFAGPYAGSAWAFCGIEHPDLTKVPPFQSLLAQVVRHLLDSVYLHSLKPSLWCYREGETAEISVKVRNDGVATKTVTVRMEVFPMPEPLRTGDGIVVGERTVMLAPNKEATVTMQWQIGAKGKGGKGEGKAAVYAVRARIVGGNLLLEAAKGRERQSANIIPPIGGEIWSGFCVWDEKVFRQAKPIAWRDNALCEWDNGEWRPRFWLGTNQTGVLFAPEATWENPLQWEWEFALMWKMGLRILRVLHLSHFAGDFENPSEEFWRRYDALLLMAHRHGLLLMPCLHDWTGGVAISDEELRRQCALVRQIGARYKDMPRVIWDIENEAPVLFRDHPDLHRLFRQWLQARYGTDKRLQEAWREPVKLDEVKYAEHKPRGWDDLKFRDLQLFRRWLIERWVRANVQALREGGAKQPVTDEIDWKVCGDHYEGAKWLDFTNLHYYGERTPLAIATYLKFHERLARGHGLAIGEFGARDHPSFRFGGFCYAPAEEVIRHFVNLPLLAFALGGSMALNWDFKDMEACIFPWGLVHQHGIFATLRNGRWEVEAALKVSGKTMAAVARLLEECRLMFAAEPAYVAVVLPDEHLLGAEGEVRWSGMGPAGRISAAVFRSLEALLRLHVHFRVVREWELAEALKRHEVRFLVLPIPFVWNNETFATVQKFAQEGGTVIITGDFTFDPDRKRRRRERLTELLGIEFVDGVASPLELERLEPIRCVASDDAFALTEWQGKPCVRVKQGIRSGKQGAKSREQGAEREGEAQVLAMTEQGEPVVVARRLRKGFVLFSADAPELRSGEETLRLYEALLRMAMKLSGETEWRISRRVRFSGRVDEREEGTARHLRLSL